MNVISASLMSLVPSCGSHFITSDMSTREVAILQLNKSLLKKLQPEGTNHHADKAALDLFIESNRRCGQWQPDETSYHHGTMLRAREKLKRRLFSGPLQEPRISLNTAMNHLRPGPGSSQGTKLTDFVGKVFNSKLTTYDRMLWEYYRESLPTIWKAAENVRASLYGGCDVVTASVLTFAKKNFDISRVINTEASLDMLFQLGLGSQMEDCLQDWFNIDLSKQPTMNRFLARLGSMYGSDATIDLKSASDLNANNFMRWLLPPRVYKTLDTVRAKCIRLPSGEDMQLETFSTMGNGFTFPLQTIVFASIVEAAYEELGLPVDNSGCRPAFSVFGDDIICVKHAYDKVCGLLGWCGFVVNSDKSFNHGSFRESCGADYFNGHDVRGVYVKKLAHETHFYSVFNTLTRWSIRNRVDLTACLRYLKGLVVFRPVPFDASDTAGIKCTLHQSKLSPRPGGIYYFRRYEPKPRKISTRDYEHNPLGLLVGALGGYVTGTASESGVSKGVCNYDSLYSPDLRSTGSITLRTKPDGDPQVRLRRSSTTSWDWISHKGLTSLDYEITLGSVLL